LITRDIKYYDPIYMGFSMGLRVKEKDSEMA
jgi:hypothetical protein